MSPDPLPQAEFDEIYAKVPRLTVEVVVTSAAGVLLTQRQTGPCRGLWHIPGGTVRYGEPLTDALARVARDELGIGVTVQRLLGYIEYPSHLQAGLGWPVGVALLVEAMDEPDPDIPFGWFAILPEEMHEEQRAFLRAHGLAHSLAHRLPPPN